MCSSDLAQLYSDEFSSYINIVEYFQDEFRHIVREILDKVAESIVDIYEFEEFERFEIIFEEDYMDIVSMDKMHRRRISTLMELLVENEEDYLDNLLDECVDRAKKYKLDYSSLKNTIEEKITIKDENENTEFDWNSEHQKRVEENEKEDKLIDNIFDSFKTIDNNGG